MKSFDICEILRNLFKILKSVPLSRELVTPCPVPPNDIDHPNMLSEFNISDSEVLNVLLNLDTTKAMGPDGTPPIVLQRCATALYHPLC